MALFFLVAILIQILIIKQWIILVSELTNVLNEIGVKYSDNQIEKLLQYASLVMDFNSHTNITGSKSLEDFVTKHIVDSLAAVSFFKSARSVIDIGAGSGLPSIPLAIIYPNIKFASCESKQKKSRFLFEAKSVLSLDNLEVINKNVYEVKNKYDIITARAFSDMKSLIKIYNHLKHRSSTLIAYKGRLETIESEISVLPKAVSIEIVPLKYNFLTSERHLVISKIGSV